MEREQPVDPTEIDDTDITPVDKGHNTTKPHVGISDPNWHVSGQSHEHKEATATRKQRRQRKHKGPRPKSARSIYMALEAKLAKKGTDS